MTRDERIKAINTAVAVAAGNVFIPAPVRVALAAAVEELEAQNVRLVELERRVKLLRVELVE